MQLLSRLERDSRLDKAVSAGQRAARLIRPGKLRDGLYGVWLGHPLHPVLVQAPVSAWLSASIADFAGDQRSARRLAAAGLAAAVPTAVAPSMRTATTGTSRAVRALVCPQAGRPTASGGARTR